MNKKLILTAVLACLVLCVNAQVKPDTIKIDKVFGMGSLIACDTCLIKLTGTYYTFDGERKDTVECLAYVLVSYKKAMFKWIKMYAVTSNWSPLNVGDLKARSQYLMPDRKTKSIYKVLFAVTK